ncbi:MAG: linear amide C-N hydrolase [Bacteroidales bacterium]|jgi:choloylglycine hydrolase|nr:linear amide C-N hydrolase [Bacteroidales bacterium]
MKTKTFLVSFFICSLIGISDAFSCTIFRLTAKDGNIMVTRSMEFAVNLHYDLIVVPRNKAFISPFSQDKHGITWSTRFGYVGVAAFGMNYGVSDGMNEKGLSLSALWFENNMQWQEVTPADSNIALAFTMFSDWVLGSFSTVDEIKAALPKIKVFNYADTSKIKMPVLLHYIVYDAAGGCIVIEYDKGQYNIYDNPLGIMTNSPSFPWQMNNLRQYIGLEPYNSMAVKGDGLTISPTGHGQGMVGLPGDYTPPSRFVRLAMFNRFVDRQPDAMYNLNLSQHVINTFTIPLGIIIDKAPDGTIIDKESTQWVSFRDISNRVLYFKTYENPTLRKIDLNQLDFSVKDIRRISMYGTQETIIDITK